MMEYKRGMSNSPALSIAVSEIVDRCTVFARQYREAEDRIAAANEAIKIAEAAKATSLDRIHDCIAAARVLDFDLTAAMKQIEGASTAVVTVIETKAGREPGEETIRDLVLKLARDVAPSPVRAAEIRQQVQKMKGRHLHPKTIGMTLYRLSLEGHVRREGWDWFYVEKGSGPVGIDQLQ